MSMNRLRRVLPLFFVSVVLLTRAAQAEFHFAPAVELDLTIPVIELPCPSLSADGLTLYMANVRAAGGAGGLDIWYATRPTRFGSFGPFTNLGSGVNTSSNETGASVSADGLSLYFRSQKAGGRGGIDLYVATRNTPDENFGSPVNLGAPVNSSSDDRNPFISQDGLTLVFDSLRPGGFSADGADLYIATRPTPTAPFGSAEILPSWVNQYGSHGSPSLSPDGLNLFYTGPADIVVSTRASLDAPWSDPVVLDDNVNSASVEDFSEFARDGKSIIFVSDRAGMLRLYEAAVVPEPNSLILWLYGMMGIGVYRRRMDGWVALRA